MPYVCPAAHVLFKTGLTRKIISRLTVHVWKMCKIWLQCCGRSSFLAGRRSLIDSAWSHAALMCSSETRTEPIQDDPWKLLRGNFTAKLTIMQFTSACWTVGDTCMVQYHIKICCYKMVKRGDSGWKLSLLDYFCDRIGHLNNRVTLVMKPLLRLTVRRSSSGRSAASWTSWRLRSSTSWWSRWRIWPSTPRRG